MCKSVSKGVRASKNAKALEATIDGSYAAGSAAGRSVRNFLFAPVTETYKAAVAGYWFGLGLIIPEDPKPATKRATAKKQTKKKPPSRVGNTVSKKPTKKKPTSRVGNTVSKKPTAKKPTAKKPTAKKPTKKNTVKS